jgi:phage shock protein B
MVYAEIWTILRLVIIFAFILLALKFIRSGKRGSQEEEVSETRMIQEIYQGMERMEKRVENLETIILEKEKKEDT